MLSEKNSYTPRVVGRAAEQAVCHHLEKQGLQLIESNYYCRSGEIDLIMKDGDIYVFVEVRLRNNKSFAGGLESVTRSKQHKIAFTAEYYLQQKKLLNKTRCRFDVVSVGYDAGEFKFLWIKQAFDA